MCGILGISGNNESLAKEASTLFAYRGPDYARTSVHVEATLAHHRLSIIDLDPRSHQPMTDPSGMVEIVFNGEIYNYRELRSELEGRFPFRTQSDTEVILNAFLAAGPSCADWFHGMFAFAVLDRRDGRLHIFRDRPGIKPLFYAMVDGKVAFASELKGLVKILRGWNHKLEIDHESLDLYWALGYIPGERTLYRNVFRLEPGARITFDLSTGGIVERAAISTATHLIDKPESFKAAIEQAILSHTISDVPVGVFFSGGTDSSLIAAVLHKHGKDLQTFSLRMNGKMEDEQTFRAINEKLKLKNQIFDFTGEAFEEIYADVMPKIDDPVFDSSIFPTAYLAKKAGEHVKVVLSGEGGDELFLGYHRHLRLEKMLPGDAALGLGEQAYLAARHSSLTALLARDRDAYAFYLSQMSPMRERTPVASWRRAKQYMVERALEPLALDRDLYLEGDLLRKIDAATSYASIEGRVPLLDADIYANAARFNAAHLRNGMLKSFLKEMLIGFLPPDLVYRSKMGFGLGAGAFAHYPPLRRDLSTAIGQLRGRNILPAELDLPKDRIAEQYPHAGLAAIMLARCLENNDRI